MFGLESTTKQVLAPEAVHLFASVRSVEPLPGALLSSQVCHKARTRLEAGRQVSPVACSSVEAWLDARQASCSSDTKVSGMTSMIRDPF